MEEGNAGICTGMDRGLAGVHGASGGGQGAGSAITAVKARSRKAERRARERELAAKRAALEAAIMDDVKAGMTARESAAARGMTMSRVEEIRQRVMVVGDLQPIHSPGREHGAIRHSEVDALARAELRRWGIVYPNTALGSIDNPVLALRNGAAVRSVPVGGSIAGAVADLGNPVR